jgi:omega-6 fatty acid desaturase (delta-12 desaturase)
MRSAKEILQDSRKYAREIRWLSWWHLWTTLSLAGCVVVLVSLNLPWAWRIPASILLGLLLVRLFIIYHDYQHGAILQRSWISKLIMYFYGLLTLNPPSVWNRSHNHHHRNTAKIFGADIGSYPVMTCKAYARVGRKKRFAYLAARHPLTMAFGYLTIFIYGMCLRPFFKDPRQHYDSMLAIGLHAALIACLAVFAWKAMLMSLIVPMTVASALGAYLFYAQHNYPEVKLQDRANWDYVFAALHSSSYLKLDPWLHWFTGNIGYHHVHHLNARIPFYRLPEAMRGIKELQSPGTTSLHPRDICRCLRLKLWDTIQEKLVPLRVRQGPG